MVLGIIAIVLILTFVGLYLYCFLKCFYASNKKPADPYRPLRGEQAREVEGDIYECTRQMEAVEFEPVTIKSFDGLELFGRYYHLKDGAPVQILFHGYRSMALRDCAGGFAIARKMGMNVLVVDQRAHGQSKGHVITLGIWERRDCISWIRYISKRFGKDTAIILSGVSMGAATVIMATALPVPGKVVCVVADSAYSSPGDIVIKFCMEQHLPARIVYPIIHFSARMFGGFHLEQASAAEAASASPVPILLIHGDDDRLVPSEMSKLIHDLSYGNTTYVTFREAGHGLSYIKDPKLYEKTVFDFLKQFSDLEDFVNQACNNTAVSK